MRFTRTPLLVALATCAIIGLLAGCTSRLGEVNDQIAVEGMRLGMKDSRVQSKLGGEGQLAPCVQGYERSYESYSVTVGFDQETSTVRRIVTKDPSHQIFRVKPGSGYIEAGNTLLDAGFTPEGNSRSKFLLEDLRVTLTSYNEKTVDAVIIELRTTGN